VLLDLCPLSLLPIKLSKPRKTTPGLVIEGNNQQQIGLEYHMSQYIPRLLTDAVRVGRTGQRTGLTLQKVVDALNLSTATITRFFAPGSPHGTVYDRPYPYPFTDPDGKDWLMRRLVYVQRLYNDLPWYFSAVPNMVTSETQLFDPSLGDELFRGDPQDLEGKAAMTMIAHWTSPVIVAQTPVYTFCSVTAFAKQIRSEIRSTVEITQSKLRKGIIVTPPHVIDANWSHRSPKPDQYLFDIHGRLIT
jgi:hypothetical protein